MTRRNFAWSFFAFIAANICQPPRSFAYQVRFFVDLKEHSEEDFFALQSKYEDNDAIDRLSSEFEKRGWILGRRDFQKSDRHLIWTYQFKSKECFEKWEDSLYKYGIVQKHGRPYNISREEKYLLV